MAKVNMVGEMVQNHSDEEIIEYLSAVMAGVAKNYRTALEKNQPEVLWGNLGDISLVSTTLRTLHKRNQERLANRAE